MGHSHPTPDQDLQLAQQAVAQGDLGHALHHVGGALSADPSHPQRLAMLDGILRSSDDPLRLTELPEEPSFIDVANRSYALALRAQWVDAFSLLAQVVATRPDIPYLAWAITWAQHPGVAQSLPPDTIFPQVLAHLIRGLPNPCPPNDPARKNVELARTLAAVLREVHPRQGAIHYFGSAIARRLSLTDEAIQLGKQALQVDPNYLTAIGYACALRDAGRIDDSIAAFKDALPFDPDDIAVWLDVGDLYLKTLRFAEAASAYQKALDKEPQHEWALPSFHFARYKGTHDPQALAALQALRDRANRRAVDLADEQLDPRIDWINVLPRPADASFKGTSQMPSPSVMTGLRLATAHVSPPIVIENIQVPDPRVAKGQVDFVLWAYDGTNARPNVPPPDPRVLEALAELATSPYHLDQWATRAVQIGAQMGPGWVQQLVCAMVHASPPPPNMDPFEWVQRTQIAAALVIAHVDQGWEGSARKRALHAIALGPVDWTTTAAVLALSRVAKADPNIRPDVEQLFGYLRQHVGQTGFTCYEYPLACAWLDLGGHPPNVQHDLQTWRERARAGAPP